MGLFSLFLFLFLSALSAGLFYTKQHLFFLILHSS
jgi:hypothetical protein